MEVGEVVSGSRDLSPADDTISVDGEGAAGLPAGAALGGAVPDALVLAETNGPVKRHRVQDVPGARHAQPPLGVQLALVVDDDGDVPVAAHLHDPALRRLWRRVRHRDEVHLLVRSRERGERSEGLLCDCRPRRERKRYGSKLTGIVLC